MDSPIRVLQVFYSMYPGGAENMIMNIYRCIDRERIQFDFIVHTEKEEFFDREIIQMGGKIFRVPRYNGKNHKKYIKAWDSFFQEHPEYHILHTHIRSTASIFLKIARRYGLVTIAHSHNTSEGRGIQALIKRFFELPLKKRADYYFACSEEAGRWLFGKNIVNNPNFYILKNAINAEQFEYNASIRECLRKEYGLKGKLVVGHVGRFVEQKNHVFLIKVFEQLLKRADARLLLLGDGKLREQVEGMCKADGIMEKVIFMGNRSDVASILTAMDVFLFPSIYEGLPVTLVEAQANGLPCVVTDTITQEVELGNLYRVSLEEDVEIWANQILKVKPILQDRKAGVNAIKESGFDIYDNVQWLQDFYENISL